MPKAFKTCLIAIILIFAAALICLAVWVAGTLVFGLPSIQESVGAPVSDLNQLQEAALSIYLLINRARLDEPAGNPKVERTIEIEPGASAQSVIDQLSATGLLQNPVLFRSYIRYLGFDRGIESGMYDLRGSMSMRELATALQTARVDALTLVVPEGWRAEQVAERIQTLEISIGSAEFLNAMGSQPDDLTLSFDLPPSSSLEGFLFPDTYSLDPGITADELVLLMLSNFEQRVDGSLRQAITSQGLSLYEAVILASIVEREAVVPEERPRIAAVFLNRLAVGMKLDADPTVQYALASAIQAEWWPQLTLEDLQIDSPFNTYRYTGLPPAPIASPGLDSLRAIAFPLITSEYYFRALCDGTGLHAFAETFDEHQRNSCP
jgi:UPF0755 protein